MEELEIHPNPESCPQPAQRDLIVKRLDIHLLVLDVEIQVDPVADDRVVASGLKVESGFLVIKILEPIRQVFSVAVTHCSETKV